MILPEFDYKTPTTKKEAVDLLCELGTGARLAAGGTDLIPNMKNGTLHPKTLISLGNLKAEKEQITANGSLKIDALSTLAEISDSSLIKQKAPSLAEAAHRVAGQQVRNRAHLGGNLCQEIRCLQLNQSHSFQFVDPCYKRDGDCCYPYPKGGVSCRSVYMSDIAPVLMTLDASLEIWGDQGKRVININDFYTGDGLKPLNLTPQEMIFSIVIPSESLSMKSFFVKATPRGGVEFAIISVAIALEIDSKGRHCSKARIAVGSVTPKPVRVPLAEEELTKNEVDENQIFDIAKKVAQEVKPLPHHGHSKFFQRQLIEVHTRRSLMTLFKLPGAQPLMRGV
ncbi:MAG: hypothetical protein GY786_15870 [Proteobacteria bacterium]|nr:hypothetical protein [Pseudomonadota bacterium]